MNIKVALVHDFLIRKGGAERVLKALAEMFPEAPIYTFLYDEKKVGDDFPAERVRTSFLQKFPGFLRKRQRFLLPFLPIAPETFDLREFDLVISSSSAFAKGIITKPKTSDVHPERSANIFPTPIVNKEKPIAPKIRESS